MAANAIAMKRAFLNKANFVSSHTFFCKSVTFFERKQNQKH